MFAPVGVGERAAVLAAGASQRGGSSPSRPIYEIQRSVGNDGIGCRNRLGSPVGGIMVREPDKEQSSKNNWTSVKWADGDRYMLRSKPDGDEYLIELLTRADATEEWKTLQWWRADERPKVDET